MRLIWDSAKVLLRNKPTAKRKRSSALPDFGCRISGANSDDKRTSSAASPRGMATYCFPSQIRNREALRRGYQARLPENLSGSGVVRVHVTIQSPPITSPPPVASAAVLDGEAVR